MTTAHTAAAAFPLGHRYVPVRASERAALGLAPLCLRLFLVAQFLSLTRLFFIQHLGSGAGAVASQAGLLSVALLPPVVLAYGLKDGDPFGRLVFGARLWLLALGAVVILCFLHGWVEKEYAIAPVLHDLAPYVVVMSFVVLGSMPRVWSDTDGFLVALLAAALLVNAIGMTEMTRVVSAEHADDRAGVATVAYRTQGALAFWPLLFLTARLRRPRTAALLFTAVFFVLAQQVLFQKRAPSVRVLLFVAIFVFVLPRLWPRTAGHPVTGPEHKVRRLFAGVALVAAFVCVTAAPWLFEGQLAGLLRRISGEAYRGGAAGMLTWENERFHEASMFFSTLEPQEYVFGRGFGGYFDPPEAGWGVWLEDMHVIGRRQLHVGALMPFFKGGLLLVLAYYPGLLLALVRGRRLLSEPLAAAAFFVLAIQTVFLIQEGFFTLSVAFDLAMVGLCMGHLLAVRAHDPEARFARARPVVARRPA